MWTYQILLDHLEQLQEHRMTPGLERMQAACMRLGSPERAIPTVHIAGTNGKGSTVAFLRTLLQQAGYRVGAYTSPHLIEYAERIAINGVPMSGDALATTAQRILDRCADLHLSYFELTTMVALCAFAEQRPDIVLVETGLGGRLDATNVVQPLAIGLTPIALDHMHLLGSTLTAIATEKCGIFKPGAPIVSAPQTDDVTHVVRRCAATIAAPLHIAAPCDPSVLLGLPGDHQRINAGVAVALASALADRGWRVADTAALRLTTWPGRCEWLRREAPLLFDAAHNVAGAEMCARYLASIRQQRRIHCAIGVMEDKAVDGIIAALCPVVDHFTAVTAPSPRALPAAALAEKIRALGGDVETNTAEDWAHDWIGHDPARIQLVTGSCYLYAPIHRAVRQWREESDPTVAALLPAAHRS